MGERDGTRDRLNNDKQLEMRRQFEAERENSLARSATSSNYYDAPKPRGPISNFIDASWKYVGWTLGILFVLLLLQGEGGRYAVFSFVGVILGFGILSALFDLIRGKK